jgi:formylglycine-generating enzyme required for sulfatase activity
MKFVSVPGTKVEFCIWETRVKDYGAYAEAKNEDAGTGWKTVGYQQEDTHPVVNVSWPNAQAFCAWLTKKELAAGKLRPGQRYRLPTDVEWSHSRGLRQRAGQNASREA